MVFTKIIRAALIVVGVLVALPLVGIDLTMLSVFGGAFGVGLGLGLQKIASNYVSGFVDPARSLDPPLAIWCRSTTAWVKLPV